MKLAILFPLLLTLPVAGLAQGVGADWDIVTIVQDLSRNSARLEPIIEQLTPNDWLAKGAPEAYVSQWQTARKELGALSTAMKQLERDPEKLSAALDAFFRLQLIDTQIKSLNDGIRQYQNPAIADLLLSVLSENSLNRGRLQQHITDLAEQKEKEFEVVDREAQRCRTQAIRQAPAPAKRPAVKQ